MKKVMFLCIFLMFTVPLACAGEKLAYVVTHKGADFAPDTAEVYSFDPATGRAELVYTDIGTPIILNGSLAISPTGRMFANAAERDKYGRRIYSSAALYELTLDGSNAFRKVAPVSRKAPFARFFVSSDGSKIGDVAWLDLKQWILILETQTGQLVSEIDMSSIFMDCYQSSIGWLSDTNRLFFSLETGDDHVTSDESYGQVGTYLMDDTGGSAVKFDSLPTREGYLKPELVRLIGVLPSGEYIYAAGEPELGNPNKMRRTLFKVAATDDGGMRVSDISFGPEANVPLGIAAHFKVSLSGKYIAFISGLPSVADTAKQVWLKDLSTGEEKVVFTLQTNGLQGPYVDIIGWFE